MFTGIIENTAIVKYPEYKESNLILTLKSDISKEFYVDQSIAHNGVCLTVTEVEPPLYKVTLIQETVEKTNFKFIKAGDIINLERSIQLNARLDGHFVTGHVDGTGKIEKIIDKNGSVELIISHPKNNYFITIPKGGIAVNGISLTVVESKDAQFSVHIIPYTFEHTNLKYLKEGHFVNLEFDIFGKYIFKILSQQNVKLNL